MYKQTVLHYIQEYAQTQPDTLAVCELRKTVTYAEYWSNIRKTAHALQDMGIRKGDHVMIRCTQNIDYLTVFTALQYMQVLVVPIEKSTSAERAVEIGQRVDAACLISDKPVDGIKCISQKKIITRMKDESEAELELPGEEDRSMLLFTTGTTGSSKGVVMHHRGDVGIAGNVIEGTAMKKGNVEIIPMPLIWNKKIPVRHGKWRHSMSDGRNGIYRNAVEAHREIRSDIHGDITGITRNDIPFVG